MSTACLYGRPCKKYGARVMQVHRSADAALPSPRKTGESIRYLVNGVRDVSPADHVLAAGYVGS